LQQVAASMTLFNETSAMLARPLFEDMIVAHWIDYNRDNAGWLVDRFLQAPGSDGA
jgi:hypothetical protein